MSKPQFTLTEFLILALIPIMVGILAMWVLEFTGGLDSSWPSFRCTIPKAE